MGHLLHRFVREYPRPAAPSRSGSQTSSRVTRPAVPGPCQLAPSPTIPEWSKQGRHGDGSQLQLISWIHIIRQVHTDGAGLKSSWEVRSGSDTVQSSPSKAHPSSRQEQSQQVRDHNSKVHSQALGWLVGDTGMHSYNIAQGENESLGLNLSGVTGP